MSRLLALVAVAVLSCGCGRRPLEPRDPDQGRFHFTIQSYNILDNNVADPSTLEALGRADADIVGLQEITPEWQAVIEERYASRYPFRMWKPVPAPGGAAGLGILSRFPVRDGGWHQGPNGWHPAWHLLIDTPAGTVDVLDVHLRNATSDNGGTVQSLLTTADDHRYEIAVFHEARPMPVSPTIVLGDFNEGPEGAAVHYLEDAGYRNALPLYHPGQPTWRYHSVGNQFTQELDHILFDDGFDPLNAWVVNGGGSDHLAVVAHLQMITTR